MTSAFIYDAVRTPFGRFGGSLSSIRPDDLAATVVAAICIGVGQGLAVVLENTTR